MIRLAFAAAALLAGTAFSTVADARCWPGPYGWVCSRAPVYGYYPASQFDNPATYGYQPRGMPHPNGPQTGGGGCYMGQSTNGCGDR